MVDLEHQSVGHNLLHLMVLHSINASQTERELSNLGEESPCSWARDMYDHIQGILEKLPAKKSRLHDNLYCELCEQEDASNYTPLQLAAALGSLHMFDHLFNKRMTIEWVFGPVRCRKLYLADIDVPLDSEEKERGDGKSSKSVVEIVVESQRLDLLSKGQLKKILDQKWSKYAMRICRERFHTSLWFAVSLLTLTSVTGDTPVTMAALVWAELFCGFRYFKHFQRELVRVLRLGLTKYLSTHGTHIENRLYDLLTCPFCLTILGLRWHVCLTWDKEQGPVYVCRQSQDTWKSQVATYLLLVQSAMSFFHLFQGMLGFPEYGHFVIMLKKMVRQDMVKFFHIYTVFLFGFSHLFYIVFFRQNQGWAEFGHSLNVGFKPVLQQVDLEDCFGQDIGPDGSCETSEMTGWFRFILILMNFFLVSLVLVNLFIAMMSSTYDRVNQQSTLEWNLVRARIITNLDRELSNQERISAENKFWEDDESEDTKTTRRFLTFTTMEQRPEYLKGAEQPNPAIEPLPEALLS